MGAMGGSPGGGGGGGGGGLHHGQLSASAEAAFAAALERIGTVATSTSEVGALYKL